MINFITGVLVGGFFGIMIMVLIIANEPKEPKDKERQHTDKPGGQMSWPGL